MTGTKFSVLDRLDRRAARSDARLEKDAAALIRELRKALVATRDALHYITPAGTTNCRFCDENMDHQGTFQDMHSSDCVAHKIHDALLTDRQTKGGY